MCTKYILKENSTYLVVGTYFWYKVHTCLYWYILIQITLILHFQSGAIALATLTSLLPTLVRRCGFAGSILPIGSLLECQAAQAWLATSKLPQPRVNLIDVAATPASSAAESAQPAGKHEFVFLRYLCGLVGVALPSRKQGIRGILPTMFSALAT